MASHNAKRQMTTFAKLGMTETVIYRPAKPGLLAREIVTMVDRPGSQSVMSGEAMGFRVTALNDEKDGIPSDPALCDIGADRIDVAERINGPRTTRSMQRFVQMDADFVTIEIV